MREQPTTPAILAAQLELRAAQLKLEAALLTSSPDVKGCEQPDCPGPGAHSQGGCPMGWAGSCKRHYR